MKNQCRVCGYNHEHLLLTPATPGAPARLMQSLGRRYVQYANRHYRRTGSLWEGRYKSSVVQAESYLLACMRYIELNPVRAAMVADPGGYRWSSYRANGLVQSDARLTPHPLYLGLDAGPTMRRQAYRSLVKDGFAGHFMGSDKRRERIEKEQELTTQLHVIESARAGTLQSEKKLAQIETDYRRQLHAERNETQAAVDKLGQEIAKQTHRKNLLELKAPQDGLVKDLATHTAGTVVQPGTVMLTLVPQDENLRAEVWVSNEDIGFVHPGQKVKLKFAAFSFQKYGMGEGVVEHVGADAVDASANSAASNAAPAGDKAGRSAPLAYKALVTLKARSLEVNGERFRLAAGMQTQAEILLGTRSVAEYLLSPVQQAWHEAARER